MSVRGGGGEHLYLSLNYAAAGRNLIKTKQYGIQTSEIIAVLFVLKTTWRRIFSDL